MLVKLIHEIHDVDNEDFCMTNAEIQELQKAIEGVIESFGYESASCDFTRITT